MRISDWSSDVCSSDLSAQADGLLPLTQKSLRFHDALAYHDYEGVALDLDERARIVRDLGDHEAMILRNHGLLTVGRTLGEAFPNRSEERRVGKGCVSTCRSRGSP